MTVITMVDHGQTVMVIPRSMMIKSDILIMVDLVTDGQSRAKYDHGQAMVDHSRKWLSGGHFAT